MYIKALSRVFHPSYSSISLAEKCKSAGIAFTGIYCLWQLQHWFSVDGVQLVMLASMAAAAVLLYAAPHSPMAQPWPLLVGNMLSASIGWTASMTISDPALAAATAVGGAILVMHLTHSLHPPAAATSAAMVLNAQVFHAHGLLWAGSMVAGNVLISLVMAVVLNRFIHKGRYPALAQPPVVSEPLHVQLRSTVISQADIEWALSQVDGELDVSEEDLLRIYQLAEHHAVSSKSN